MKKLPKFIKKKKNFRRRRRAETSPTEICIFRSYITIIVVVDIIIIVFLVIFVIINIICVGLFVNACV